MFENLNCVSTTHVKRGNLKAIIIALKGNFKEIFYISKKYFMFLGNKYSRNQQIFEPSRGKTNNVVPDQVRHKPGCTVTEDG